MEKNYIRFNGDVYDEQFYSVVDGKIKMNVDKQQQILRSNYIKNHQYFGFKYKHYIDTTINTRGLYVLEDNNNIYYNEKDLKEAVNDIIINTDYAEAYRKKYGSYEVVIVGSRGFDHNHKKYISYYSYSSSSGLIDTFNIVDAKWFSGRKDLFAWWLTACGNFDLESTIIRTLNIESIINHLKNNTLNELNKLMSDFDAYCNRL